MQVHPDELTLSADLMRTGRTRSFEDRLLSSIESIGLAEPLKIAPNPEGGYVVVDGALRLKAIQAIRERDSSRFHMVDAYCLDFSLRYEVRYQSDIYQDLLPSQLATFVEHLHRADNVRKADIAAFIGVSPATLRNYTGLWRLLERGNLFAEIVSLMDVGVMPASNPYAWLRLTDQGLEQALADGFAKGADARAWVAQALAAAQAGSPQRFPLKYVEAVTGGLPAHCYRVGEQARAMKRDLGLRRAAGADRSDGVAARRHLTHVAMTSSDRVLAAAAKSLEEFLSWK